MPDDQSLDTVRSEFIEKIGLITQDEGLPRIAGRVFGMLVFDGNLVSFGDLADRLQVSRASISTSIRLLEERGLVKRIAKPGERQDYFQLAPNPYATMLEGALKRTRSTKDDIVATINRLPAGEGAVERLSAYARFYGSIDAGLDMALHEIRTSTDTLPGAAPETSKDTNHDR